MPSASANSLTVSHSLCSLKIASCVSLRDAATLEAKLRDEEREEKTEIIWTDIFRGNKWAGLFPGGGQVSSGLVLCLLLGTEGA